MTSPNRQQYGVTLVELMVAMTIMSIIALTLSAVMTGAAKAIHISKSQALASNLAQEKVESLKNISYYRLLVTTSTLVAPEPGVGSFNYDNSYYPSEELTVGQITYTRRVLIQKVTETGTTISANNWYDADTGLKQITVYVTWPNGTSWKKMTLTNLRDNPNRQKIDAVFTGTVKSGLANLQDATVVTLENPLLRDASDPSGVYLINTSAGDYQIQASKVGYFSQTISSTIASGQTLTVPFNLAQMAVGSTSGIAYLNNHLVLASFCAAVDGDNNLEYVVLYNPTSQSYVMSTGGGAANYLVNFARMDTSITTLNKVGETVYTNTVIAANRYFLIASSPVVNGVTADAYYSNPAMVMGFPEDRLPINTQGGLAVVSLGAYEVNGTTVDAVGWSLGAPPRGPANAHEGNGINEAGLQAEWTGERMAYSTSTSADMAVFPLPGIHANLGNAYDSNENSNDWIPHFDTVNDVPVNSSHSEAAQTGTPAIGALVFVDDKLSGSSLALGAPIAGTFTVTNIATGTWNILVSSGGWYYLNDALSVTTSNNSFLGNIHLSSQSAGGFASGRVMNGASPVQSILVTASGASDTTDPNGYYRLTLNVDTYTITANPNNDNSSYTVGQATGVIITAGAITDVGDIFISLGGSFQGYVSNGTDPMPGIPVVATDTASGAEIGSSVTNSLGVFKFANISTGSYVFSPQLEVGETSSPSSITKSVINGTTVVVGTFTITNAFGTLAGAAALTSGAPINTGVLIVAVAQPNVVGGTPPDITDTVRNSTVYYYMGSADSEGNYSIRLRSGTYNIYAWYTPSTNGVMGIPSQLTSTAVISAGASTTKNFTW